MHGVKDIDEGSEERTIYVTEKEERKRQALESGANEIKGSH